MCFRLTGDGKPTSLSIGTDGRHQSVPTRSRSLHEFRKLGRFQRSIKWHLTSGVSQSIMPFMNAIVTLDKAGRVVIPKTLRDELQLAPGDSLALESHGERMMLRPVRSASALRKEQGIWVFRSGRKLSAGDTDQVLDGLRQERDRKARGA